MSYKFKTESSTPDPTVIQQTKVFSFVSYSNLGLVTDRDGTDEIVKVELELHPDGTDNFDYLLNVDFKMEMKPEDKAVFNPNGNSFTPTN